MGESMLPRAKAERRGFYRGFSSQSRRELGQAPGYHLKMLPRLYCVSVGERGGGLCRHRTVETESACAGGDVDTGGCGFVGGGELCALEEPPNSTEKVDGAVVRVPVLHEADEILAAAGLDIASAVPV